MAEGNEPINTAENLHKESENLAALKHSLIHKTLMIDVSVLVLYLIGATYVFSILVSLRPNAGSWYLLLYVYLFPGILNRLFKLLNRSVIKKYERRYRWSFLLLAIVVGLTLIGPVSSVASDIAMDRFERAYQPLVDTLHENKIAICDKPGDAVDIPDSTQTYMRGPETIWIHFLTSRFIISTRGGSIDIDGSTIYYDSEKQEWNLFHNDNQAKADGFNLLIENSKRCKFS
ncbi:MAG: hypothetical protein JSU67_00160 [Gammaproteobacteria bacterium]|nr:MAG: hypothetical protein JSU67_00160 [Gammaproteobacteria bacterium]